MKISVTAVLNFETSEDLLDVELEDASAALTAWIENLPAVKDFNIIWQGLETGDIGIELTDIEVLGTPEEYEKED